MARLITKKIFSLFLILVLSVSPVAVFAASLSANVSGATTGNNAGVQIIGDRDLHTVTFNWNHPNAYPPHTVMVPHGQTLTESQFPTSTQIPLRPGFTFLGWGTSHNSGDQSAAIREMAITGTSEFFAQWRAITYTIIYHPGSRGTFEEVRHTDLMFGMLTPEPPPITGQAEWRFTRWSPTRTLTVSSDVTYVAQWEQIQEPPPPPTPPTKPPQPPPFNPPPRPPIQEPPYAPYPATPEPTQPDIIESEPEPEYVDIEDPHDTAVLEPGEEIISPGTPLGGETWALINLILTILCVLLGIFVTIWTLYNKSKERKEEPHVYEPDDYQDIGNHQYIEITENRHNLVWFNVVHISAIVGIVIFILTQDMTNMMALIDRWTIVHASLFAIQIIATILMRKRSKATFETTQNGAKR